MLRIGQPGPPPIPPGAGAAPPPLPPDAGAPPPLPPDDSGGDLPPKGQHFVKISPITSGYLGPEDGPFLCDNCIHFDGKGSCEIVDGKIDPQGCCNLFESASEPQDQGPEPGEAEDEGPDQNAGNIPPGA